MISAKALLDPTILFFLLGVGAGLIRSNLAIPSQMARFLALYLLMALGLKGGFALAQSGFQSEVLIDLGLAIFLAVAIPMVGFAILRKFIAPLSQRVNVCGGRSGRPALGKVKASVNSAKFVVYIRPEAR